MKRFNCKKLIRVLGVTLISTATLYGFSTAPVHASLFQKPNAACMAEQAGFDLNCTAKDIRVTSVENIRDANGNSVSCAVGTDVTFYADVSITTTANARYDYSVYLPEGNWSAQEYNTNNSCSILLGETDTAPGVDMEDGLDQCADISKAAGYDATQTHTNQAITLYCRDDDNSGFADFNYCAAWHNKEGQDCSEDNPAAPGTPSKCRCEAFDIDIAIKPNAPEITKTLTSASSSAQEPGGEFTFTLGIYNPNTSGSLFITSLEDLVDVGADASIDNSENYEFTLDLWNGTTTPGAQEVTLASSNCVAPSSDSIEILAGATYSCEFTISIHDTLISDSNPEDNVISEFYNDVIVASAVDVHGDPVTDEQGTCVNANVAASNGKHCSNIKQVQITDKAPAINVSKTPSTTSVSEDGEQVTFAVVVSIPSSTDVYNDSPLTITELVDDEFGPLQNYANCADAIGAQITANVPYSCSFTVIIGDGTPGVHMNTVTATAKDDENTSVTSSGSAQVDISNEVPDIVLTKTALGIYNDSTEQNEVVETGDDTALMRDVDYQFIFTVSGSDSVIFTSLYDHTCSSNGECSGTIVKEDIDFIDLNCEVDQVNTGSGWQSISPQPINGFELAPGHEASCTVTMSLQGNRDDSHKNIAYVSGYETENMSEALASNIDSEVVVFIPAASSASMNFATSSLVIIEIVNGSLYNATLSGLTVNGTSSVFANDSGSSFAIMNDGGFYDGHNYPSCQSSTALGHVNSGSNSYQCAFTIEWAPGLSPDYRSVFGAIEATLTSDAVFGDPATALVTSTVVPIAVQMGATP